MTKRCEICNTEIEDIDNGKYLSVRKYCSKKCANSKYSIERPKWRKNVARATVGAISELLVCADLSTKGYDVFRATSASCSCDILALKDKKILRIEVRTSHYNIKGVLVCNPKGDYDILAKVLIEKHYIEYEPDILSI